MKSLAHVTHLLIITGQTLKPKTLLTRWTPERAVKSYDAHDRVTRDNPQTNSMCSCQFRAFGIPLPYANTAEQLRKGTCMTAGTCALVTQAFSEAPSRARQPLKAGKNKQKGWLTERLIPQIPSSRIWSFQVEPDLKVVDCKENPQACNSQHASLWIKALYCTPMSHQTELAFPPVRKKIPLFFLTLILRCSVEGKTRCVICTVQPRCSSK